MSGKIGLARQNSHKCKNIYSGLAIYQKTRLYLILLNNSNDFFSLVNNFDSCNKSDVPKI